MNSECKDKHCPIHGHLSLRKATFVGTVVSAKAQRTVVVQWIKAKKLKKYRVYMRVKKRVLAHNPDCISAKEGDQVVIRECRPISKWKKFVVVQVLSHGNRS